jgi:FkbM family methyltransferase
MLPFNHIREVANMTPGDMEIICRSNVTNAYLGNNIILCRVLSKYKMYVNTLDCGIAPHLIIDGYWESWLTQCLARIVEPGSVCIDIGANVGYYTLLMSELAGKNGRTIAVEPNPDVCKCLKRTQSVHGFPFEIMEAAVSNRKGYTSLNVPASYPGSASIATVHGLPGYKISKVKVRLLTLDEMVLELNLPKVDIIKVDVEGLEPQVFEGMQQTINNNPDLKIVMEYSPFIYESAKDFTQYLFSNFTVNRIKDVDQMVLLDESSITSLCELKDHTDLYLQRKI